MHNKRNINADIIRIFALFMVFTVHIFLNNGFYQSNVSGLPQLVAVFIRQFAMTCVPLFLLLSGYLQSGKEMSYNKKYFCKLGKILVPYTIITIITYFVQHKLGLMNGINFFQMFFGFVNNGYTWHIEMYIGLFLLMPLINAGYNHFKTKKEKTYLIVIFYLICFVPSIINTGNKYMPDYWKNFYPIAYYVIGMYLKEFPLKLKKITQIGILILSQIVSTASVYFLFKGNIWHNSNTYVWICTAINSILVVSLLSQVNTSKAGNKTIAFVKTISDAVLPAYMISSVIDLFVYDVFVKTNIPTVEERLMWAIPIMLAVAVISILLGIIITKISNVIIAVSSKLAKTKKENQNE